MTYLFAIVGWKNISWIEARTLKEAMKEYESNERYLAKKGDKVCVFYDHNPRVIADFPVVGEK